MPTDRSLANDHPLILQILEELGKLRNEVGELKKELSSNGKNEGIHEQLRTHSRDIAALKAELNALEVQVDAPKKAVAGWFSGAMPGLILAIAFGIYAAIMSALQPKMPTYYQPSAQSMPYQVPVHPNYPRH